MDLLEARRRKFNVEEYHRMSEAGILHEGDHVELVGGELFDNKTGEHRLFTVDEYFRMGEVGLLQEDDRVELIEGEIVEISPIGSRHAACVKRLNALLGSRVEGHAIIGVQDPVLLPDYSGPQPDVMILRPREDFYEEAHPTPRDVLLLIEVSDTTLRFDREVKLPLYASAGIPEVWIVDLVNQNVHAYSRSTAGSYGNTYLVGHGDSIAPRMLPGLVVNGDEVLG